MKKRLKIKFLISRQFQQYMKMREWTVQELADKTGFNKSQICAVMLRQIEPSKRMLRELCEHSRLGLENIIETIFE